ncbi:MAG: GNAT family N-acetyltransferase [Nocardioidaceae bacterium]|nr:GNAT family N-acetyltransferase [Nocardioidaceae bacterium]
MATIARVTADDVADVVPLLVAYCRFYDTAPPPAALQALSEALLADTEHEGMQLVARDDEGNAVGFATLYWSWDTTEAVRIAILHDLYVAKPARGAGIGRALIDAAAGEAARHGKQRLAWQTAPDNQTAQRVYDGTAAQRSTWVNYTLPV